MQIDKRLSSFKKAVRDLAPDDVIQRHITFGLCEALSDDQYFRLKQKVATQFSVHPSAVIVVGSAKLGFSIAPTKRYRSFHDKSDIDVAIVSSELFDRTWKDVLAYKLEGGDWPEARTFMKYHFQGWMRPDKLPPSRHYAWTREWWDFFTSITHSGQFGPYKVAAGLYKSWSFLERYQRKCIDACKLEIRSST